VHFFFQRVPDHEIIEFAKTQLTLPDKIDPSDVMSWQHHLYSKLGSKKPHNITAVTTATTAKNSANQQAILDELVERIVTMAKVLYGLHTVIYSASLDCCANIILFFSL
jgi:ryanodine receptor 2